MNEDTRPLTLFTLGTLRLVAAGAPLLPNRRKELALLGWMLRRGLQPVRREEAAALLWGDGNGRRARHSLRQALLTIRQAAGDVIVGDTTYLTIGPRRVALDIAELDRHLIERRMTAALPMLRGEFMPGLEALGSDAFRRWLQAERAALQRRVRDAFQRALRARTDEGDWAGVAEAAAAWAEREPLEERAHAAWIEALHLLGRSARAARLADEFVQRFRRELNAEPPPVFRHLAATARLAAARPQPPKAPIADRHTVLAELTRAWGAASEAVVQVRLLTGGGAAARAQLADDLERFVRTRDAASVVLRAAGHRDVRDVPWATASALLKAIAGAGGVAASAPHHRAEVARLVPELRQLNAALPLPSGEETALQEGVAGVLRAVAAETPLLVLCDEAALADAATRRLLLALSRTREPAALLLVLTAAEHDVTATPELAALARWHATQRVRLDGDADDADTFVEAMAVRASVPARAMRSREPAPVTGADAVAARAAAGEARSALPGYSMLPNAASYSRARHAALRALALDDAIADAHAVLGVVTLCHDWDIAGAESRLCSALEAGTDSAIAHGGLSKLRLVQGRAVEALAHARLACQLEPRSVERATMAAACLYMCQHFAAAEEELRRVSRVGGDSPGTCELLSLTLCAQRRHTEAVIAAHRVVELSDGSDLARAFLATVLATTGRLDEAQLIERQLRRAALLRDVPPLAFLIMATACDDRASALAALEAVIARRGIAIYVLAASPLFDTLRGEPRFGDLLRRAGLSLHSEPLQPRAG